MADTSVIVFFVGLTVFSSSIPNDCGVKAIVPRVDQHVTQQARPKLIASQTFPETYSLATEDVESHQAVIVFKYASLQRRASSWGPIDFMPRKNKDAPLYGYVTLDGDRVRFITNASNVKAEIPPDLALPRLRDYVCPANMQKLRAEFLPPYNGAAAVFDLPEGTLQPCLSSMGANQRIDVKLPLNVDGNFVISASTMKEKKELVLAPDPDTGKLEVMIANVPTHYLRPKLTSSLAVDGLPHVHAYYAMAGEQNGQCEKTLLDWFNDKKPAIPRCTLSVLGFNAGRSVIDDNTVMSSFECSNTQWP